MSRQRLLLKSSRFWTVLMSATVRAAASCSSVTLETPMWRILPSFWSSLSAPID
jgi:hypothetical protein